MNLLSFRVYQILSEYSNGGHALAIRELLRLLWTEYGLRCGRREVYAALDKLRAVGCHIPEYQDDGEGCRLLSDAVVFTGAAGLKFWALQYVPFCQVLEPDWLRKEISDALRTGWENYRK